MDAERVRVPKLEGHDCFACGTNNPIGLRMEFYRQGNSVCSDVVLSRNHVGWQNMVHGGIISTLLDEVMSWTVIYFKKSFVVTRRMEMRYLRPVPVDIPLTVKGKIAADEGVNTCQVEAVLLDGEGKTLARGKGEFAFLSGERLTSLPEDFRKEMIELFERFD